MPADPCSLFTAIHRTITLSCLTLSCLFGASPTFCVRPGRDSAGGRLDPFRQLNGYVDSKPEPLARAPENVFVFRGVEKEVLGWRNVFDLPIQYDVELCPGLLSADSPTLSYRFLPEGGPRRRFVVIGECMVFLVLLVLRRNAVMRCGLTS